jgi:hypothetical protein
MRYMPMRSSVTELQTFAWCAHALPGSHHGSALGGDSWCDVVWYGVLGVRLVHVTLCQECVASSTSTACKVTVLEECKGFGSASSNKAKADSCAS